MKKLYATITLFLISFSFYGQIVNIPDANFKNALLNSNCAIISGQSGLSDVDLNNDGEIEESEALSVFQLQVYNMNISSLTGIGYFSNINYLICSGNNLQELNLDGLSQIIYIECDNNMLTSLDFSELNSLRGLNCENNLLINLILPAFPNQTYFGLDCSNNQLTTLNLNGLSIGNLDISYNNILDIEIPYIAYCEFLNISGNQYATISISAGEILEFYCIDTSLESLNLSGVDYFHYALIIKDNLSLQNVNMQNNRADFCFDIPGNEGGSTEICPFVPEITNNPSLNLICVDDRSMYNYSLETLVSETEYYSTIVNNSNVVVSTQCLLTTSENILASDIVLYPNPTQNKVSITVTNDVNVETIIIYNVFGQTVKTIAPFELSVSIDVSSFKAGTYFIEINSNQGKTTKKFVKI